MIGGRRWAAATLGVAAAALAACTRSTPAPVVVSTVITTDAPASSVPVPTPSYRPVPAEFVPALPPSRALPAGQVAGTCPYLDTRTAMDIEGNRIGSTAISTAKPTTCTFYYAYSPARATLQIAPTSFATHVDAYNAMVLTGQAGTDLDSRRSIVPGVDAVLYRTKFYAPDVARNWACTFAAGTTMVTVRTDRIDSSYNALQIATAIAGRF